ncbi:hypothetical protein EVAR_87462_1 [Eumeta japonica]|uniref:Uncharacterized protein n=1 Tax=Eumeta variegata TaxID=151549 RepID=A0A4C1W0F5_EUMVA|nr:hypothetical protein EVAR_87462_1 [Eumeta japonica]
MVNLRRVLGQLKGGKLKIAGARASRRCLRCNTAIDYCSPRTDTRIVTSHLERQFLDAMYDTKPKISKKKLTKRSAATTFATARYARCDTATTAPAATDGREICNDSGTVAGTRAAVEYFAVDVVRPVTRELL